MKQSRVVGTQINKLKNTGSTSRKNKIRWKDMIPFYVMMIPGMVYLIINNYIPMFGIIIAFKKLDFQKGILGSEWIGLDNFKFLFASKDAWTITRNTVLYSVAFIVLGSLFAITTAILLNEVRSRMASRLYQSLILLPYLMSWVVVSYLGFAFLSSETGTINSMLRSLGFQTINFYNEPQYWPFILIFTNLWKTIGYGTIIYLSNVVSISKEYYETAAIDGATKWQQIRKITLPLLKPTIITMFILQLGNVFRSDFGLFYQMPRGSGALFSVTRTLDVYVYTALMKNSDFGMSSAASFYQSIVGFILIVSANALVRKVNKDNALF